MSAMVIDANKVNSSVMPNLTKAKSTLEEAYKLSNTLLNKLPSTAGSSRSKISNIKNKITTTETKITTIKSKLNNKIEKAKSIESKSKSKTVGLATAAAGAAVGFGAAKVNGAVGKAVVGGAIGAAKSAVAGATVGLGVGLVAAQTAAKVAAKSVSKSKNLLEKAFDFVKDTGSKIVQSIKSGWNKFTTGVKKVVDKTTTVVKTAATKLKNTCATVAKSVCSFVKNVGTGIKVVATACKKVATKVASFVKEKTTTVIKTIGKGLAAVGKFLWRTAATVVNLAISLVEGIVSFVEAVGDVVLLVVGGLCTVGTALWDVGVGICTGDWSWKATGAVWKKWIMPWIGYDWTSKAFSWNNDSFIDKAAFSWAKREDGIGYKIGKGVGYYVAMIAATVATMGAAGAASSAAAASSVTAKVAGTLATKAVAQGVVGGLASIGKNAQKNYNSTIDKKVTAHYIEQVMLENPGLTEDEAAAIVASNLENGLYTDKNVVRKSAMDNISGSEIFKGNIKAVGSGIIDGSIYYLGGTYGKKVGGVFSKIGENTNSKIIKAVVSPFAGDKGGATAIKMTKAYISEGYNSLTILGGDGEYDWGDAHLDAASIFIAEKMVGVVNGGASKFTGAIKNAKVTQSIMSSKPIEAIKNSQVVSGVKNVAGNLKDKYGEHVKRVAADYKKIKDGKHEETGLSTGMKAVRLLDQGLHDGILKAEEKAVKDVTSNYYDNIISALPIGG